MKNVIIYTRVSTDEQADKGFSLLHQKDVLEKVCAIKGYNIIKHYQDDYSAKNFDRPAFNNLMDFITANRKDIDMLLFTKWDRFSRNIEESYRIIRKLKSLGVEVNAIEQPLDLDLPDNKVMLAIYLAIPEVENDKNSIRTTDGMRRAQKEGCWMGSALYAYDNWRTPDGKASMKPNDKAKFIIEAFETYSKGLYATEELRKVLFKKGMKLRKQQFYNVLKNIAYTGKIRIKAYGKEDEQIVEGLHDGLVSMELFKQVQAVIKGKKRIQAKPTKKNDLLPLRGYLVCDKCGKNLTGSASTGRGGKKHYYYHCQKGCKERFKAPEADKAFLNMLAEISIKPEVSQLYNEIIKDVFNTNEVNKDRQIEELEKEINKLKGRLENAEDNYLDGNIDQSNYEKMTKRLNGKIGELIVNQTELKFTDTNLTKYLKFGLKFLENIDTYYMEADLALKHKIIGSIFPEKLTFSENKYRTVQFNYTTRHFIN